MSERLGPILYDSADHSIFIGRDFGTTKSYSEETAAAIDEEVKKIFDKAAAECERILTEHREQLIAVAEYLLAHETMEGEEFDYYFEHGEFMPESARDAKKARSDASIERPARVIARFDDADEAAPAEKAEGEAPRDESAPAEEPENGKNEE